MNEIDNVVAIVMSCCWCTPQFIIMLGKKLRAEKESGCARGWPFLTAAEQDSHEE